MSKKRQFQKPETVKPIETPDFKAVMPSANDEMAAMPFSKGNYFVMLIGIALILTGFVIMTLDKEEFGFGFLGLTLGPVIAFIGFMVEFYAILKKQ